MATKKAVSSKKHSTTIKHKTKVKASDLGVIGLVKENRTAIGSVVAEFIGTFLLVASIFSLQNSPVYVPFAIIGIVMIIGGISGAHINPAMTIGALITKKISGLKSVMYIVAQLLGAGAAWLTLQAFSTATVAKGAATTSTLFHAGKIADTGKEWPLLFAELLGAVIIGFGVATFLKAKSNKFNYNQAQAAITYAFTFFIASIVTYSATMSILAEQNTAVVFMNPAVALAANAMNSVWTVAIYAFAPIVGAVVGFVLCELLAPKAVEEK